MSKPSNDFDIVTSATNDEIKALLPNVDFHAIQSGVEYAFARYPGEVIDVAAFTNIREGIIDTMTDAHLEFSCKPQNAIRALRFKSRYDYKLSPRVDKAIRAHVGEYIVITCRLLSLRLTRGTKKTGATGAIRDILLPPHSGPQSNVRC